MNKEVSLGNVTCSLNFQRKMQITNVNKCPQGFHRRSAEGEGEAAEGQWMRRRSRKKEKLRCGLLKTSGPGLAPGMGIEESGHSPPPLHNLQNPLTQAKVRTGLVSSLCSSSPLLLGQNSWSRKQGVINVWRETLPLYLDTSHLLFKIPYLIYKIHVHIVSRPDF